MSGRIRSNNGYCIGDLELMYKYTASNEISANFKDNRKIFKLLGIPSEVILDVSPLLVGFIDPCDASEKPRDYDLDINLPKNLNAK